MVLYVNSCAREESRTNRLAQALLQRLGGNYVEVNLYKEDLKPLTETSLAHRTALISAGDYSSDLFKYAKQFAQADTIVIAAPYWDLSFPAMLKIYIENIYVTGIVSRYNSDGSPEGLCRAKKLYYVTTAGGPYQPEYSFGYLQTMSAQFFGIKETELIMAEMLDVDPARSEELLRQAIDFVQRSC